MHNEADCQDYTDFLEAVPALSTCTREVIEEFVSHNVVKVHCMAGKKLNPLTDQEQNTYVLASGSALLHADDITVALEPGDYFGRSSSHPHHVVASVVAQSDIDIFVINVLEIERLLQASSRDRHPSQLEWTIELPTNTRQSSCRSHRNTVLVGQDT
jgi:CRP-like cAMP-binding protein